MTEFNNDNNSLHLPTVPSNVSSNIVSLTQQYRHTQQPTHRTRDKLRSRTYDSSFVQDVNKAFLQYNYNKINNNRNIKHNLALSPSSQYSNNRATSAAVRQQQHYNDSFSTLENDALLLNSKYRNQAIKQAYAVNIHQKRQHSNNSPAQQQHNSNDNTVSAYTSSMNGKRNSNTRAQNFNFNYNDNVNNLMLSPIPLQTNNLMLDRQHSYNSNVLHVYNNRSANTSRVTSPIASRSSSVTTSNDDTLNTQLPNILSNNNSTTATNNNQPITISPRLHRNIIINSNNNNQQQPIYTIRTPTTTNTNTKPSFDIQQLVVIRSPSTNTTHTTATANYNNSKQTDDNIDNNTQSVSLSPTQPKNNTLSPLSHNTLLKLDNDNINNSDKTKSQTITHDNISTINTTTTPTTPLTHKLVNQSQYLMTNSNNSNTSDELTPGYVNSVTVNNSVSNNLNNDSIDRLCNTLKTTHLQLNITNNATLSNSQDTNNTNLNNTVDQSATSLYNTITPTKPTAPQPQTTTTNVRTLLSPTRHNKLTTIYSSDDVEANANEADNVSKQDDVSNTTTAAKNNINNVDTDYIANCNTTTTSNNTDNYTNNADINTTTVVPGPILQSQSQCQPDLTDDNITNNTTAINQQPQPQPPVTNNQTIITDNSVTKDITAAVSTSSLIDNTVEIDNTVYIERLIEAVEHIMQHNSELLEQCNIYSNDEDLVELANKLILNNDENKKSLTDHTYRIAKLLVNRLIDNYNNTIIDIAKQYSNSIMLIVAIKKLLQDTIRQSNNTSPIDQSTTITNSNNTTKTNDSPNKVNGIQQQVSSSSSSNAIKTAATFVASIEQSIKDKQRKAAEMNARLKASQDSWARQKLLAAAKAAKERYNDNDKLNNNSNKQDIQAKQIRDEMAANAISRELLRRARQQQEEEQKLKDAEELSKRNRITTEHAAMLYYVPTVASAAKTESRKNKHMTINNKNTNNNNNINIVATTVNKLTTDSIINNTTTSINMTKPTIINTMYDEANDDSTRLAELDAEQEQLKVENEQIKKNIATNTIDNNNNIDDIDENESDDIVSPINTGDSDNDVNKLSNNNITSPTANTTTTSTSITTTGRRSRSFFHNRSMSTIAREHLQHTSTKQQQRTVAANINRQQQLTAIQHRLQEQQQEHERKLLLVQQRINEQENEYMNRINMSVKDIDAAIKQKNSILESQKLALAAKKDDIEKVSELLNNHKNELYDYVNASDSNGSTALFHSCWPGYIDTCKLLLEAGANVNHQNVKQNTVLHFACYRQHYELISLFISYNANPTLINVNYKVCYKECDTLPERIRVAQYIKQCLIDKIKKQGGKQYSIFDALKNAISSKKNTLVHSRRNTMANNNSNSNSNSANTSLNSKGHSRRNTTSNSNMFGELKLNNNNNNDNSSSDIHDWLSSIDQWLTLAHRTQQTNQRARNKLIAVMRFNLAAVKANRIKQALQQLSNTNINSDNSIEQSNTAESCA